MGYSLYTGEILTALADVDLTLAAPFFAQLEALTDEAATMLADATGVTRGPLSHFSDGQAACTFAPANPGDPLPDVLHGYDMISEWQVQAEEG
jgi:hypothetical protein